jgi:hypothetical protein
VIAYQGGVRVGGSPYNGDGYFKFAVVNAAGDTTYWSNDGSSTGGGEPAGAVQLAVSDGVFGVLLGDTSLGGMTEAMTAGVFGKPDRHLRVWFSTSGGGPFDQMAEDTRIAAVPYALQAERVRGYAGVVVVAKSGGDCSSVQEAIDSITDATANNPYLVWVAPGVYQEQVTMKPHVHLQGAGQEATGISSDASSSAWPPDQATLVLASDTSLRDLAVGNYGTGTRSVALLAPAGVARAVVADVKAVARGSGASNVAIFLTGSGTSVTLEGVTAEAENGTSSNLGLFNFLGAAALLRGGSFEGRGGADAYCIRNNGSGTTLDAEGVTALAQNGSVTRGLHNEAGAAATLRGGSFTARGGEETSGIVNADTDTRLDAKDVTVLGEDGSDSNEGLNNEAGSAATLRGGSFTGRGGINALGINSTQDASLEAEGVTAQGENGSYNYGLWNKGTATLRGGSFIGRGEASTWGIINGAENATLDAEDVTALGEDGWGHNCGLQNRYGAAATLRGGSFTGRGGAWSIGIENYDETPADTRLEARDVTALGEDGSDHNYGLLTYEDQVTLRGGSFIGRGGTYALGISSSEFSSLEAEGVTALGEGGSSASIGLVAGEAYIRQSVLEGATHSVRGGTEVSHSRLAGGAVDGTATCVAVSYLDTFYPASCPP